MDRGPHDGKGLAYRALWCAVLEQAAKEGDTLWFRSRHAKEVLGLIGMNPDLASQMADKLEHGVIENAAPVSRPISARGMRRRERRRTRTVV
jgi:hypothetical protein